MRRLSIVAIAAISTVAFTQIASAADLPVKAPVYKAPVAVAPSWTGWYIGLNAGAGWSRSDVSNTFSDASYPGSPYGGNASAGSSGDITDTAFTGGIQAGYNWQTGAMVFGLETDFNYLGIKASRSVRAPYGGGIIQGVDVNDEVKADYLGTLRGRLGYASGNFLLYATGGLAYTTVKHSHDFSEYGYGSQTHCFAANFCDLGGSSESKFKLGWTLGGGVEWAFDRNWSLKAEYLYADFGDVSSTTNYYLAGPPPVLIGNAVVNHSADLTVQVARVGINYRF